MTRAAILARASAILVSASAAFSNSAMAACFAAASASALTPPRGATLLLSLIVLGHGLARWRLAPAVDAGIMPPRTPWRTNRTSPRSTSARSEH